MLKRYYDRLPDVNDSKTVDRGSATDAEVEVEEDQAAAKVLEEDDGDDLELFVPEKQSSDAGSPDEVHICPDLSKRQKDEIWVLLREYQDIFSNIPGKTDVIEQQIVLTDSNPVRTRIYPVSYSLRNTVKEELSEMVKLGIVEPSNSPYSSPLLMLKKKDGTNRPVVDYRGLNLSLIHISEPTRPY